MGAPDWPRRTGGAARGSDRTPEGTGIEPPSPEGDGFGDRALRPARSGDRDEVRRLFSAPGENATDTQGLWHMVAKLERLAIHWGDLQPMQSPWTRAAGG